MKIDPIIVSDSLKLRLIHLDDAQEIFNIIDNQRQYLGKWLPFVACTQKVDDTINFIKNVSQQADNDITYVFSILFNHQIVGLINLKILDEINHKAEFGYWISKDYQKRGIITQSLESLCNYVFNQLGINRIQIKCAVDNKLSKKVPKNLQFIFEGIEREGAWLEGNTYSDLEIYSMLKKEWK